MRFRDDKLQANHTTTVDSVIESIMDRVTEKDLMAAGKRVASLGVGTANTGQKRKAEEQGNGRPSPGPGPGMGKG